MDEICWRSRGYIPHFDKPGLIQGVTFHLWDSIPAHVLESWLVDPEVDANQQLRERFEQYLNAGYGCCYLKQHEVAVIVENALLYFDDDRYRMYAWVIMPNHVHALFEPFVGHALDDILHSWKSYTAVEGNRVICRQGKFWFREYFDRYIRDANHFSRAVNYIHFNPVAAGLVDSPEEWPYGSARLIEDWRDVAPGRFRM